MSLEPRADDGVPEMTARVVRAAFPEGTLAIRTREALGPLFADGDFAAAFPRSGRPAASPGALELDDPGFDFTILGDFRTRLIRHEMRESVLDAVLTRLSAAGLLRSGGRQRTDSTHVLAAVRALNRMEFAGETLRAALEALAAAAPGWLASLIDASRADRYGARTGSCRFPEGEDARARWLGQAGRDGFTVLDAVTAPGAPERLRQVPASSPCGRHGSSSTTGTGGRCAGGRARTSRQAETAWPRPVTPAPATASSAGRDGRAARPTSPRPATMTHPA